MPSEHHGFIPSSAEELLRQRVKAELRKRARALRQAVPAASCAARSARIVERLAALDAVARARAVALFWPIEDRHEVDLRGLDAHLRGRNVAVAYPTAGPAPGVMVFRFVERTEDMRDYGRGFREPSQGDRRAEPGAIDVIVTPALAVDPRGHRIGYGAGYYDRALPQYAPPAATIAVAFDFQLMPEVPTTEGDVATDWLVTDARVLRASPTG